jgi:hypothetical protein
MNHINKHCNKGRVFFGFGVLRYLKGVTLERHDMHSQRGCWEQESS